MTAQATHESIRNALSASTSPIKGKDFVVYLQGSYKNYTNIRADSDVDVVLQLNSVFKGDTSSLSESEKTLYEQAYHDSTYSWQDFRTDTLQALREYYDIQAVTEGNKSLKIASGSNRLPADVVVCLKYLKFKQFLTLNDQKYVEGIAFYAIRDNRWIFNFPNQHFDNGAEKNSQLRTNGLFRKTVRMFKNARSRLVDDGAVDKNLAPSYFLECLVYNVPDKQFVSSCQSTFCNVVNWLSTADLSSFVCQNEQLLLFGNTQEQWSISNAKTLLQKLADLWQNWR